jgi:methionyl-tRNA synthetase
MDKKKFFVTTPIYYINDLPHIGHAYATFAADILARYHALVGNETFLLTGSDENSQKTVEAAEKKGLSLEKYSDEMAANWKSTWEKLGIGNGQFYFVRTTNKQHEEFVRNFFQKVYDSGFIEPGTYEGLYCIGHEAFLKESDLTDEGFCPDHKTKPEKIKEKNYFFKLSAFQNQLLYLYEKNPEFVQPEERRNEVISFVKKGLEDISISRETAKWGIKIPFDETQVIYVWFDALLSYYSATPEKFWPADIHIIGKDILRFHAVIWPAMLLAAGEKNYPLPKKVFAHGFFTIDGTKISKSLGNSIDPLKISAEYGTDALRYYLFKEFPFGNDGDFSFDRLKEVYNSDLANGLGNLVARVAKLAQNLNLEIEGPASKALLDSGFSIHLDKVEFQQALDYIWNKVRSSDKKIEETKPWELVKENPEKARSVVSNLVRQILEIQELLLPFLPETAKKIAEQFSGPKVKNAPALFPRK